MESAVSVDYFDICTKNGSRMKRMTTSTQREVQARSLSHSWDKVPTKAL